MPPTDATQDPETVALIDRAPQEKPEPEIGAGIVPTGTERIPISEYARHRKQRPSQIFAAIAQGRLATSVIREQVGGRWRWWVLDVEAADREWDANTRPKLPSTVRAANTEQRGAPAANTSPGYRSARENLATAQAAREAANAEIAKLELAKRRGELIDAKLIRAQVRDVFTNCRTRLLALPIQIGQRIPSVGPAGVELIRELVKDALKGLASELRAGTEK